MSFRDDMACWPQRIATNSWELSSFAGKTHKNAMGIHRECTLVKLPTLSMELASGVQPGPAPFWGLLLKKNKHSPLPQTDY